MDDQHFNFITKFIKKKKHPACMIGIYNVFFKDRFCPFFNLEWGTIVRRMLNRPKKENAPGGNYCHHSMTSPQPTPPHQNGPSASLPHRHITRYVLLMPWHGIHEMEILPIACHIMA
jgi:hypothetical protein